MSLQSRLSALITEIGADIKALQDASGGVGTKVSDLPSATVPLDGSELVPIVQGGASKKVTREDLTGVDIVQSLTATQANSTTTPASVTGLETVLTPGTYLVKVWVCFRCAATTTGLEMYLELNGGSSSRLVSTWYTLTTGGTAATGVADQATTQTAQMMEGKGQRASGVRSGPMQGVDSANSDQFAVLEAIVIVTATGTLRTMFASEVASSAVTMMEGTSITVTKTG